MADPSDPQKGTERADEASKAPSAPDAPSPDPGVGEVGQDEIEALLNQAESAVETARTDDVAGSAAPESPPAEVDPAGPAVQSRSEPQPFQLQQLDRQPSTEAATSLDLLRDVELNLQIELGRARMYVEDVLKLRNGSVLPLDKLAGDPVDIYANGRHIARGEVLVLNDNFCVRITEILSISE